MTTKLTLTLDSEVIRMAKEYAASQGVSLSKLVEQYFAFLTREQEPIPPAAPWVADLAGSIELDADFDYKDELREALKSKYE